MIEKQETARAWWPGSSLKEYTDALQELSDRLKKEQGEEHMTPDLYQFNCEVEGVELQCKLEYEPPEENYPDAPDIDECMNLVNAYTNGVDIAHLLMQSIVDHICESALEDMKENSNDY